MYEVLSSNSSLEGAEKNEGGRTETGMAPLTRIVVYSHTNCPLPTVSIKVTTASHRWIEPWNSDLNTEKKNFMSYLILANFSQNKSKRGHV